MPICTSSPGMKSSVEGLIVGERAIEVDRADSPDGSARENSG
jgi:hypothetical protein